MVNLNLCYFLSNQNTFGSYTKYISSLNFTGRRLLSSLDCIDLDLHENMPRSKPRSRSQIVDLESRIGLQIIFALTKNNS